jgi:glycosyltransferase involved in cell wall biosynthesis
MHVHSSKAGVVGRIAARVGRLPVVYTPHCFAFIGPHPIWRKLPVTLIERGLANVTDLIICVCENERQEALQRRVSRPNRFRVVHNGVAECPDDLETDPHLASHARGGPLAACLAALRPQKAVDVFVRAAPRILSEVPQARLAVIGEGGERSRLEELARRLHVDERLQFFDFRPPAARQLSSIDVFVLSSAWEAFPIAILEALACGVPQVATDVGGTSEAVIDGETGLLCPAGSPDALASRVSELLVDPERRAGMARQSLNHYRANFSWDRMAGGTAAVLEEAIGAGARVTA